MSNSELQNIVIIKPTCVRCALRTCTHVSGSIGSYIQFTDVTLWLYASEERSREKSDHHERNSASDQEPDRTEAATRDIESAKMSSRLCRDLALYINHCVLLVSEFFTLVKYALV